MEKDVLKLESFIEKAFEEVRIVDLHTHLFSECFKDLFLYGIDGMLTYHYLIAEAFRYSSEPYDSFINMTPAQQAEFVWKNVFVDNTPVSEAARSVITVFDKLGLDVNNKDLNYYRKYFESIENKSAYVDRIFELAGLEYAVMTNDPFSDYERSIWEDGYAADSRFKTALRLDVLLNVWELAQKKLCQMGYKVAADLSGKSAEEIKRFLNKWIDKMEVLYCAASLPPSFSMEDGSIRARIIEECVLPLCREKNIPLALMIGVRRNVNPLMSMAGDSLGKGDIRALEYLCSKYPGNKFMVTMLSLENQHELIITARKFRNIMLFGCWWYMNNPSIIENLTRMRLELLGTSFIPQHSDCRILEQLICKWEHSRSIIKKVLVEKYGALASDGYILTEETIKKDVENLFGGNFKKFLALKLKSEYDSAYYSTEHYY